MTYKTILLPQSDFEDEKNVTIITKNISDLPKSDTEHFSLPEIPNVVINRISYGMFRFSSYQTFFLLSTEIKTPEGDIIYTLTPELNQTTYLQRKLLGEGTYGKVYFYPSENIVLKRSFNSIDTYFGVPHDFVKELGIYNLLQNSACSPLLFDFILDPMPKLILEKGETTLYQIYKALSPEQSKQIIFNIAKCMKTISELNIIHGDLKPDNILVYPSRNNEVKIIDWGIAQLEYRENPRKKSPKVQAVQYASPEIFLGVNYTYKIDIFSLGLVFLRMILQDFVLSENTAESQGRLYLKILLNIPDTELDRQGLAMRREFSSLEAKSNLIAKNIVEEYKISDEAFVDLISKMLEFNPHQRISYTDILAHRFFSSFPISPTEVISPPRMPVQTISNLLQDRQVNQRMRQILFDWLKDVAEEFKHSLNTLCLTFQLVDLFTHVQDFPYQEYQLVGIAAYSIAQKMFESADMHLDLDQLKTVTENSFSNMNICYIEQKIIFKLKGNILMPTLFSVIEKQLDYISDTKVNTEELVTAYLYDDVYTRDFETYLDEYGLENFVDKKKHKDNK